MMIKMNNNGNSIIYISPAHSPCGQLQKFKRIIIPLLKSLCGEQSNFELSLSENQLCINNTPIGEYMKISNFKIDFGGLMFNYGSDSKFRVVMFDFFDNFDVEMIADINGEGFDIVYSKYE